MSKTKKIKVMKYLKKFRLFENDAVKNSTLEISGNEKNGFTLQDKDCYRFNPKELKEGDEIHYINTDIEYPDYVFYKDIKPECYGYLGTPEKPVTYKVLSKKEDSITVEGEFE